MRIAGNQIQQVVGTYLKQTKKTDAPGTAQPVADEATFSERATDIAKARQAYDAVPEVREDLVASLKARIANDTYRPQDEQVAEAIIRGQTSQE